MERGNVFSAGANRYGLVTLDHFRVLFSQALKKTNHRPDKTVGSGDHDLNPGMLIPRKSTPASVLIPVIGRPGHPTILLTKRSESLSHHAGQVSFPGGRMEESDASEAETALRETEEEIGLRRKYIEIIGQLETYDTRTGFRVTPVVGLVKPPFELRINPIEVAEIFEVPVSFILNRMNHERHSREWQDTMRKFYVLPHPDHYIWGATAGMLVNLAEMLLEVLEES
ncbi:MAG: CoA pyrophosphatase [Rhodospirillaceae bacterium]|nr:CoA pyrophosphatase [Rhodospirillaceae bacterium]